MNRAGFAVLMVLTVSLVRVGDSHKATAGGRKEAAETDRGVRGQQQSGVMNQGHSPRGSEDGASADISAETSFETFRSRTLVRLPRGTPSYGGDRHIPRPSHAAGASRKDHASAPRDVAQRAARQLASQQQRSRVNRRQSSKPSSASTRRLVG